MSRDFDLVVFGASGFTGQFVVEEVARTLTRDNDKLKWAISGRSRDKLKKVLEVASKELGQDLSHIDMIEADVSDSDSLSALCRRTRLVINCVGPYRLYGEQMIKACLEARTHHVDISGEPLYLESMQLNYHEEAKQKGIYIVGSCGWDSIPCDMGVAFLKNNFKGQLNSVETFMKVKAGKNGGHINTGTWESMVHGVSSYNELRRVRRNLYIKLLNASPPKQKYKLPRRNIPFWNQVANGWCLPFPGSDRSVVQRTQRFQFIEFHENPTQAETYFVVKTIFNVLGLIIFAAVFGAFSSFGWGRNLLLRYPSLFSFGTFRRGGPSREELVDGKFELLLIGKGWEDGQAVEQTEPNKTLLAKVTGPECGYIATSSFLVQSGLTILRESTKMPFNGGVFTPGSAFINTSILDKLKQCDIHFEIVENA